MSLETPLDLAFVRAQFPPLSDPRTSSWAHMENAGGSYVAVQVLERMEAFHRAYKVQPYGRFEASVRAGEAMDESRRALAEMLGVGVDEILLGPSTTQNAYVIAHALRGWLRPGDEVVVTEQDHEANIGAWRRLEEVGCAIREWRIDPVGGELDPSAFEAILTERTRLVCFTHCSNIVGSFLPVRRLADLAHAAGAIVVVDGVSAAPHLLPDLDALGADVYLFSLYKTWGPHLGLAFVRREHHSKLKNQGHFFKEGLGLAQIDVAGPNHAAIACAAGIPAYYDALYAHHLGGGGARGQRAEGGGIGVGGGIRGRANAVFDLFAVQEERLARRVAAFLSGRRGVRLLGCRSGDRRLRAPTFSFVPERIAASEVVDALLPRRVAVRNGHFYAYRCIRALGLEPDQGVVRISLVHYNTEEEVDRLLEALDAALP